MSAFGPQAANAALVLPSGSDVRRYGAQQTWVKDATAPGANDGTVLDAAFFNRLIGNLEYIVSTAGISAVPGDNTVLYRAILQSIVAGAPAALDTLAEIAAALGGDMNFATHVLASIANCVQVGSVQSFTGPQKAQARNNMGLGSAAILNAGTAVGNLVQLDISSAKLPAVDGSLLTNVVAAWSRLTGVPSFAAVSLSGAYADLSGKPTLGSAAALNVGTAAGNVVELDGSGKLPAVDGSALINMPSSGESVGAVTMHTGNTAPGGKVEAKGALLSRTGTYANLWAYAQTSGNIAASDGAWTRGQYSPGDGATTFRIPDLRGIFIRGWDDSAGVDSGRTFGSYQADAMQGHVHTQVMANSTGPANGTATKPTVSSPEFTGPFTTTGPVSDGTNGTPRVAAETRPMNVALLFCIKY